jgi:GNAT superfamily N-acetyltransferase
LEGRVLKDARRLEIIPFDADGIDDAARLLAARHRAQRIAEPGLDPAFEDVATTRVAIEGLMATEGASGALASRRGAAVGYVLATPRSGTWGPSMWVEGAGQAVADVESDVVRDLYGFLAGGWVATGRYRHSVIVPATDPALVEAWFRSGFGQQHVHGIRGAAAPRETVAVPDGMTLRRAERRDIVALGGLGRALAEHQIASPVFSTLPSAPLEDHVAEWEEDFEDERFANFVVEVEGRVIGAAVGCSIDMSSEHHGIVRPATAGLLGFAAVLPEARGLGAGRVLGAAVLAWARDAGYTVVVTDWRETNLLSSRTWPRLGYRPVFRRLHRAIA